MKVKLRVFLRGHNVAIVTFYVGKMITTCSPKIGHFFDLPCVCAVFCIVCRF